MKDLKMVIRIKQVDPTRAEVVELIHQLDKYQESMYPPESNHLDSVDELSQKNVNFLAAYIDSAICGIGAVKILNDYGEIKRLYVPGKYRGNRCYRKQLKIPSQGFAAVFQQRQLAPGRI